MEGNSDTLVGKMLFVAVGYSVGSWDAGTPGILVGGMLFVAVGCSVGSKERNDIIEKNRKEEGDGMDVEGGEEEN